MARRHPFSAEADKEAEVIVLNMLRRSGGATAKELVEWCRGSLTRLQVLNALTRLEESRSVVDITVNDVTFARPPTFKAVTLPKERV